MLQDQKGNRSENGRMRGENEGVGDVRREELEEWEIMTKRRSSERGRPCASTIHSTERARTN